MAVSSKAETNVLIAEDDDDDFFIFSLAIKETQIAIALMRVENGEILMKTLNEHIPDILFLDMHMPCKSGKECIREIRADRRYDHLPIIIYSSFSDDDHVDYCFREGANLYTVKPYDLADFTRTLQRILGVDWKRSMYYPPKQDFVVHPSPPAS
jgi:CheY-like chemotaxis protein